MNVKHLSIITVAAVAAMLVASTVLANADDAFADKKKKSYSKSQAATQVNDCGNGDEPFDVFCQNLASQIQGDGNTVALEGEQGEEENGDLTGQPDKNS
jgi:uncharacterized membrane protein